MQAVLLVGCIVAAIGTTTPAYAASGRALQATSVEVTSSRPGPTDAVTGSALVLHAAVSPSVLPPRTHISGTVTWTITGHFGIGLTCSTTTALSSQGKASCSIGAGALLASESPYRVKASYSGDTNFAASSAISFQSVAPKPVHLRMQLDARPASDQPTTVTVEVSSVVAAAPLITGYIGFIVTSTHHTVSPVCNGGAEQQLINAAATCVLPAGWVHVGTATPHDRNPVTDWSIQISYGGGHWGGQVNFTQVTKSMHGSANVHTAAQVGPPAAPAAGAIPSGGTASPTGHVALVRAPTAARDARAARPAAALVAGSATPFARAHADAHHRLDRASA